MWIKPFSNPSLSWDNKSQSLAQNIADDSEKDHGHEDGLRFEIVNG